MAARIPTRRTIAAVLATTTAPLLLGACGDRTEAGPASSPPSTRDGRTS
ncbi:MULTISPECIES: hypothetical protein [unclassified Streptomyces]